LTIKPESPDKISRFSTLKNDLVTEIVNLPHWQAFDRPKIAVKYDSLQTLYGCSQNLLD